MSHNESMMSRIGIQERANPILVVLQVIDRSEATMAVEWTSNGQQPLRVKVCPSYRLFVDDWDECPTASQ